MSIVLSVATYRRLRGEALWQLLASTNAPITIALLERHLGKEQTVVPVSTLVERLTKDIENLRADGCELPQTAQAYISHWVAEGYLIRRLPVGAAEEVLELSAATAGAIRVVDGLVERRATATESRLSTVIQQLVRLAEETDPDAESRLKGLMKERARIDREIELVQQGELHTMPDERSLERAREIIALSGELSGDFRNVRDQFERLNRELRQRLLDHDGSRGTVLDALFSGVDVVTESEAGRTFNAFWRLLTDPEQSAVLEDAVENVMHRDFTLLLSGHERRFLSRLIMTLLDQGEMVHEVLQSFARSLKQFVQSREYREQRRMNQLLNEAQQSALAIKERLRLGADIDFTLMLSTSSLKSLSQWVMYDPAQSAIPAGMNDGDALTFDLNTLAQLVAQSEIDFRELKGNIRQVLGTRAQATIAQIVDTCPIAQGLGSIVGYLALGSRHGIRLDGQIETVTWEGRDEVQRHARIPTLYFTVEKLRDLE